MSLRNSLLTFLFCGLNGLTNNVISTALRHASHSIKCLYVSLKFCVTDYSWLSPSFDPAPCLPVTFDSTALHLHQCQSSNGMWINGKPSQRTNLSQTPHLMSFTHFHCLWSSFPCDEPCLWISSVLLVNADFPCSTCCQQVTDRAFEVCRIVYYDFLMLMQTPTMSSEHHQCLTKILQFAFRLSQFT